MAFENLPLAFQSAFQSNMLDKRFQDQIEARSRLRRLVSKIPIPVRVGEQMIYTRAGELVPVITADNPTNNTLSYDLGINAPGVGASNESYPIEQWPLFIAEYSKSLDCNIIMDEETLASFYRKNWDRLAKQAALSMDLINMQNLAVAYESGSSWVTATTTGTTVSAHLDNVYGLSTAFSTASFGGTTFSYGSPNAVSGSNTLGCTVYPAAGGASYAGTISAVAVDSPTNSSTMQTPAGVVSGASGTLTITFASSKTLSIGDVIVASDAPTIIRPNNKQSRYALGSNDTLSMQLFINAKGQLRANGVDPFADGTYACLLDPIQQTQIFTDPQFQIMTMGLAASPIFKDAVVSQEFGLTFIETTNSPIYSFTNSAGNAVISRRAFLIGEGALQEGTFEGMASGYSQMADMELGYVHVLGDSKSDTPWALITRPALDRKAQIWSQTWIWIGGVAAGTDVTITSAVVPTASSARYKRALCIETIG